MKPLITISFPVYEGDEYVADSLKSVLAQDYENLEILIIDDCGKTNAMQIVTETISEYATKKDNIRVIHHPCNLKNGGTRNTSIDHAKGEYIFFVDSDDTIVPNCITTLFNAMGEEPVEVVKASYAVTGEGNVFRRKKGIDHRIVFHCETGLDAIYAHGERFIGTMTNAIYRLGFLKENNIRCVQPYLEDEIFFFTVATKARNGIFLPDMTYNHFQHDRSTINRIKKTDLTVETAEYAMEIIQHRYRILKDWENVVTREKALLEAIQWGLRYLYKGKKSSLVSHEVIQDDDFNVLGIS